MFFKIKLKFLKIKNSKTKVILNPFLLLYSDSFDGILGLPSSSSQCRPSYLYFHPYSLSDSASPEDDATGEPIIGYQLSPVSPSSASRIPVRLEKRSILSIDHS